MPDRQKFTLTLLLTGVTFLTVLSAGLATKAVASVKKTTNLSVEDCGKCHAKVFQTITSAGLAHKSRLTCIDCHEGHPPEQRNIIPTCKKCHSGSAHFRLDGCSSCHYNAHSPRKLRLPERTTTPCLTCHSAQGADMEKFPSRHTTEGCTACHKTHGAIPGCLDCHRPHAPAMTQDDCRLCHQAHKPHLVRYDNSMPSLHCAVCHPQVAETLTTGKTLHHNLRCASCHKSEHRQIPPCVECHPPHTAQTTVQGGCNLCHQAHAPLPVLAVHFAADTPSATCGACHGATLKALQTGKSRHQRLECITCHKGNHGSIPRCQQCHGPTPHSQAMLGKFAGCSDCHGSAHALFK